MEIKIQNISKTFENKIFENFSLDIPDGKTTVIMGKSGCGKTTLFNMLCGILKADNGEITFSEPPVISAVFQENRLFETFTGYENLKAVTEDEEKIRTVLEICEATDFADTKVKHMSGGMKRRISIARALCFEASLYLMDEPFKGIDIAMKDRILFKIQQYLSGKTCVIITHDIAEAVNLAHNMIILASQPAQIVYSGNISKDNIGKIETIIKNI
ncbi:MAG: ABC transporter ATP-binding protein [Firmicutes bacterium]|nr:ABC transporter ATP-binding protein [Bacillota bacterium]